MAKTSKKKIGKAKAKGRRERRFYPRPTTSATLVRVLGGGGAAITGAGAWAEWGHAFLGVDVPPYPFAPWLVVAGSAMCGVGVWLGTSGEAPLRVGSGGIAIDKGRELVRIPWYEVERIVWAPEERALRVHGKDDVGRDQRLVVKAAVHPLAAAWIAREGRERVPDVVDVPDEVDGLPRTRGDDGEALTMDAVQVVGRRCAASDRVIAYEPDARVCPQCERVYYRAEVPEKCACGASLAGLREPPTATAETPSA